VAKKKKAVSREAAGQKITVKKQMCEFFEKELNRLAMPAHNELIKSKEKLSLRLKSGEISREKHSKELERIEDIYFEEERKALWAAHENAKKKFP